MKAMILAAGLGTRMRPLTNKMPKPLLRVKGEPLLAHLINRLREAGCDEIIINVSYMAEQIECYLLAQRWGVNIRLSKEEAPLETAGGLIHALPFLGDQPFVVVNSDVWIDLPFSQLVLTAQNLSLSSAHLILVDNPDHNEQGDFRLSAETDRGKNNRRLLSNDTGEAFTYSGIGIFHPALFRGLKPGKRPLGPLLRTWIDEGKITGEKYEGFWLDVGTPQRLQQLNEFLVKA